MNSNDKSEEKPKCEHAKVFDSRDGDFHDVYRCTKCGEYFSVRIQGFMAQSTTN